MAMKRIAQEHRNLQRDPPDTYTAGPSNNYEHQDPFLHWTATVAGPPSTPYAKGVFELDIHFPETYPRSPPHIVFVTPVFHPNVSSLEGEIRLAELEQGQWSPAITVRVILISLQAMLSDPNALEGCILNEEAGRLFLADVEGFRERARRWTMDYAIK